MDQAKTPTPSPQKKGRAAPVSNDDQFLFLISCIRHSVNGKVDFTEVANECGIVSKGAAAKRYERMMKAHGIHQPTAVNPRDASVASAKRGKADSTTTNSPASKNTTPAGKKRKVLSEANIETADGDDEEPSPIPKKKVKKEGKIIKSEIKKEVHFEPFPHASLPQFDGAFDDISVDKSEPHATIKSEPDLETAVPAHAEPDAVMTVDDENLFDEFLNNYEQQNHSGHGSILIAD